MRLTVTPHSSNLVRADRAELKCESRADGPMRQQSVAIFLEGRTHLSRPLSFHEYCSSNPRTCIKVQLMPSGLPSYCIPSFRSSNSTSNSFSPADNRSTHLKRLLLLAYIFFFFIFSLHLSLHTYLSSTRQHTSKHDAHPERSRRRPSGQ